MLAAAQSPLHGDHHHQKLNSGHRIPLQPKNNNFTETPQKPNKQWIEIVPVLAIDPDEVSNKENKTPIDTTNNVKKMEELPLTDVSLADELSSVRKRLERLRLDRERTEDALRERSLFLDSQMREVLYRGEYQKMLEMEVDRLFRLKELKSYCLGISPVRSLRDKEQNKKFSNNKTQASCSSQQQEVRKLELELDLEESVDENEPESPTSVSSDSKP